MIATLALRNESGHKRVCRRDALERLANRICVGEAVSGPVEISVLLCDDDRITRLNHDYAGKNETTDVLSFEQEGPAVPGPRPVGDIVISLDTAARNCGGDPGLLRREIDLLFCHGLLHLLGHDHDTQSGRDTMRERQARYLNLPDSAAWRFGPRPEIAGNGAASENIPRGGTLRVGR